MIGCPKCAELRAKTERVIVECHAAGLKGHHGASEPDQQGEGRCARALAELVAKLDEIEAHPSYKGMWPMLMVHGFVYNGPTWEKALGEARAAVEALKSDEGDLGVTLRGEAEGSA